MTEKNESIWQYNSLEINEDNEVVGSAYTFEVGDGYDIQVSVFSYTYERDGEFKMNHVPGVTIVDEEGNIEKEVDVRDSNNPEKAIENALDTGEYVYKNIDRFID